MTVPCPPVTLRAIDSHTGSEPTRLIVGGFPGLDNGSTVKHRDCFARDFDRWRQAVILEPRGNDVLVGALLYRSVPAEATAGVIFFNNTGFLDMCGHDTTGPITSLARFGHIQPGIYLTETPVGDISAMLRDDGSVSTQNVPARRWKKQIRAETAHGPVIGDIAWGSNWFLPVNDHPFAITPEYILQLAVCVWAVRGGLETVGIRGDDGGVIDHTKLFANDDTADSHNFVPCPRKVWGRSLCSTGINVKLAYLAQDGRLQSGEIQCQASIIGSQPAASYQRTAKGIIPTIHGEVQVCGDNQLILNPDDPSCWGIAP